MTVLDDTAALSRFCVVCKARPKQPCSNTIRPGEPLPGRSVHYARATNLTSEEKESRTNDASYP